MFFSVWLIESSDQTTSKQQQQPANQRWYCYENVHAHIKEKKKNCYMEWEEESRGDDRRATGLKGTDIIDSHLVKARKLPQRE